MASMEEEFRKLELEDLWDDHFKELSERSRRHSFEVADSSSNKEFNRYDDVKPYDKSRVKLLGAQNTDYINANLITVPKAARQYILTQGPLPKTLGHFWLMVWEQKSNVIVMLNRILERLYVKCERYWPSSIGSQNEYKDVRLTVTLNKVEELKHYTIREMTLHDQETDKSRTILQFHYTAWPDYGQPDSPTSFLRLLTAIRKSGGLDKMDEPTIVHCSAGIGRSGTFCLIDSVLSMVENQGSTEGIDIVNTLLEMRDYRMGLIQTPVQLRFAYMSIVYGIKILERGNKLNPHISSIKDSVTLDNGTNQTKVNGSTNNANVKKARRNKKKHNTSNSGSLNVFRKHLLVEALDDIDSDSADSLFYDTTKHRPNIKKARNSSPEDFINDSIRIANLLTGELQSNSPDDSNQRPSGPTRAEQLANAINSLLPEKMISNDGSSASTFLSNAASSQSTDSVLLRRRERELKNQRLAEKTRDIKNRMKLEELKRENYARRMARFKQCAIGGVAAVVLSSIIYIYLNGGKS